MKQPRGAAGTDLVFFIFFIILLGIVWALTGGPDRSISREGPFLNPPSPLGDGSAYNVPSVNIPSSSNEGGGKEEEGGLSNLITRIRTSIGFIDEERSPYAGAVSLSASRARESDPDEEYVTIKTSRDFPDRTVISRWRIESTATHAGSVLGQAAYLPYSGQVNTELDVAIAPNTTIYVVTGRSPIGASFRLNTCTGYFEQFQDFAPRLPRECPSPEDALYNSTPVGFVPTDQCLNFVEDIDRCTYTVTEIPGNVGGQCQSFILNTLTYSGCVTEEKNNPSFYKNEWRIFLDRDQELWKRSRERIRLLDENGKVIDAVTY